MKYTANNLVAIFMLIMGIVSTAQAQTAKQAAYLLHEGDSLDISVWGDQTLSKVLRVLPDGSISFPLAGRVVVAGRSSIEVEKIIGKKLKTYLPDPVVTVVIVGTEGSKVYILGKVKNPGPIPLTAPLTVLHALSIAGGPDKFADLDDIKILRSNNKVLLVDYSSLIQGEDLNMNYILKANDTILVP